jgi:hypothetical protein
MMRFSVLAILLAGLAGLVGCSGGGGGGSAPPPPPPTGTLNLTVVDGDTDLGIVGARVIVIDGDTGNPVDILTTDVSGKAGKVYNTGSLQLKISADGYGASPAPGIPPLPVNIVKDQVTAITVNLFALPVADRGSISGQVTNALGQPVIGALVVATAGDGSQVSTIAGSNGSYVLYNVPVGDVTLGAFLGGLNFPQITPVSVSLDANTVQAISATSLATGQISGHVSFTSISGDIIDITLLHPGTREVLPGLRTFTDSGGSYVMYGVPNGTFEIIASLDNDGYVLDPDVSVTQGIPQVTINNNVVTEDFKVTGSIALTNPATSFDGSVPVLSDLPTFTWLKDSSYSSAEDYVVEVVDESGVTVWGGFDELNNFTPYVTVAQGNTPSVAYNMDGTATVSPLEAGRYYQLRVYARKSDVSSPTGYVLLSASETLDGIFKVATPTP